MTRVVVLEESELRDLVRTAAEEGAKLALAVRDREAETPETLDGVRALAKFARCSKTAAVFALTSGELPAERITGPSSSGAVPSYRWKIRRADAERWALARR